MQHLIAIDNGVFILIQQKTPKNPTIIYWMKLKRTVK